MDLIPIGEAAARLGLSTSALRDHPARQCATMIAALDRLVDGATVDELAVKHTAR